MAESQENLDAEKELEFLGHASKLKHLLRTGWVKSGVETSEEHAEQKLRLPETVGGHMYRMAIMSAFILDDANLDIKKCMMMSLIHDYGESIIGDITPKDGVDPKKKYELEKEAIDRIASLLPDKTKGDQIRDLFEEFENGRSEEAKAVRDLDTFDMILQAWEYEKGGHGKKLHDFFISTVGKIQTEKMKKLEAHLRKVRDASSE